MVILLNHLLPTLQCLLLQNVALILFLCGSPFCLGNLNVPALTQRLSVPWLVACSLAAVSSCQGSVSGLCTANFQAGHVVSFLFFSPFETGSCFVSEANFKLLDTSDSSSPNNWNEPHEHCVYTSCILVVKSTSFEFDFLSAHLKMFRAVLTVSMFFRMFSGASYNRNFASIFHIFWTEADSPVCRVLPILPLCESLPCLCLFLVVLACSGLATSILEGLCF